MDFMHNSCTIRRNLTTFGNALCTIIFCVIGVLSEEKALGQLYKYGEGGVGR